MPELGLNKQKCAAFRLLIPWLERLSRWFLAGVMIFAAVPKLSDPAAFAEVVGAYGLLPDSLVLPAAIMLPLLELLAAFLLIRGSMSGLWFSTMLMLLFIAVLSYGIWLGLDIDCGCFDPEDGESQALSSLRRALVRDVLLLIPLLYCLWYKYILPYNPLGERQ